MGRHPSQAWEGESVVWGHPGIDEKKLPSLLSSVSRPQSLLGSLCPQVPTHSCGCPSFSLMFEAFPAVPQPWADLLALPCRCENGEQCQGGSGQRGQLKKRREKAIVSEGEHPGTEQPQPSAPALPQTAALEPISPGFSIPWCQASVKQGHGWGGERKTEQKPPGIGNTRSPWHGGAQSILRCCLSALGTGTLWGELGNPWSCSAVTDVAPLHAPAPGTHRHLLGAGRGVGMWE